MTADSLLRWEIFSPCRVAELAFFAYLLEPMLRKSGEAFNHNSKEEGLSIVVDSAIYYYTCVEVEYTPMRCLY